MLNLAGPAFDFGNVLFAVLEECEHKRGCLVPLLAQAPAARSAARLPPAVLEEARQRLSHIALEKLAEIRQSYEEMGGTAPYWEELEREVFETAMPRYSAAAIEQTRLEQAGYDLWRKGDPAARMTFGLVALTIGGIIVRAPFIPIAEDAFAFALALSAFFYPEIKRLMFDFRHNRAMNRLVAQADRYQKDRRLHFATQAQFEQELRAVGTEREPDRRPSAEEARPLPPAAAADRPAEATARPRTPAT